MLKEIIKVKFNSSVESELDLGNLDPSFDAILARGDYHINFAGHDQGIVFENIQAGEIKTTQDLAQAMKRSIEEHEIEGIQSLIFTFIGDEMDYASEPVNYEFCVEIK